MSTQQSSKASSKSAPRLYVKGIFTGFRRGKTTQQNHTALIKIQNVETVKDASFYVGKRVAYVYR
eukprot:TRINITY_DN66_c0_g1_i1.p2 TRINITY_DN66_c0_g1~~TRINITY_DN66_c0_g1_i1.p2  ORF type:complete len:65 (+),score=22.50 TRINITY_DN66_c0_g1_i1:34-228(+)